jgi:hypothetical protein
MVAQVRYSVAERLRGRVAPCAVCTMHVETRSADFLVEPQNPGRRFVSGFGWFLIDLGLKTDGDGFHRFGLKKGGDGFCGLASKPATTVSSRFGLKTSGDGF